jgi:hypothetical protein
LTDKFENYSTALSSPASKAFAITPNDTADLAVSTRGLWIGGDGSVKITTVDGDTVTLSGCGAGTVVPVRVKRVFATGTTATNILGFY